MPFGMKIYRTTAAIVIESSSKFYMLQNEDWDAFINDDAIAEKIATMIKDLRASADAQALIKNSLLPPIQSQEVWAAGVTYYRSKVGRQEESKEGGGGDFYARVYEAERPEIFFKNTAHRTSGSGQHVRIRKDSDWNVPEPELTLMVTSSGRIIGYTIGNDMSSRSIEGENPLYLPQAKCYDKSAAIGPCIYITTEPLSEKTEITIEIIRGKKIFEGSTTISQIKRSFEELVSFLFRETGFPYGALLMTGTGVVPPNDFTLQSGDELRITIEPIGTLVNMVE